MSQTSRIHRYADSNVFVVGGRGVKYSYDEMGVLNFLLWQNIRQAMKGESITFLFLIIDQTGLINTKQEELHICCEKHVGIEWPNFQKAITRRYFRNYKNYIILRFLKNCWSLYTNRNVKANFWPSPWFNVYEKIITLNNIFQAAP